MLAHAIVLGMEKIDRTRIDARFAAFLDKLLRDRELSNAGVERLTGGRIGYNRVRDLRRGERGPVRLGEYVTLCEALGIDPEGTLGRLRAQAGM